jgi:hypothetical protein
VPYLLGGFALASLGLTPGSALGQEIILSEGFEGLFPPAGWVTTNESGFPWQQKKNGHKSDYSAGVTPSTDEENSWMIARGVKLTQGGKYTISYWRKSTTFGSDDASYRVCYGTSQDTDGMSIPMTTSRFTNANWARRTHTFTPPATGTYYLGFQCNSSDKQSNGLFIDDVCVRKSR